MDKTLSELAHRFGAVCVERGAVAATAESCTGGWIAATITAISGSSAWLDRGFVTYSNEAKSELLGVRPETINTFGAVSEQTAHEMAAGAIARSRATIAVSVTGVAGPTGGSAEKPVGTVCFGWAVRGGSTQTALHRFAGDREQVRRQSVIVAIEGMIARLRHADDLK